MRSTSSNRFRVEVELDEKELRRVNLALRSLGDREGPLAMRRAFRKWTNLGKKTMSALAPYGRNSSTEKVRGQARPNPHIRDAVSAKVKGWRKGQILWAAIGIREIPRSYATPHWYSRWVEFGHALKRAPSSEIMAMRRARGAIRRREVRAAVTVGKVPGRYFMTRTLQAVSPQLIPMLNAEIDKEAEKIYGRPG